MAILPDSATARNSDPPVSLGSALYDEYAALLLKADDARQALHVATISGDRDARNRTTLNREAAIGDLQAFKERLAGDLMLALRFCEEIHPGRIAETLGQRDREDLELTHAAILRVEDRLDSVVADIADLVSEGDRQWAS